MPSDYHTGYAPLTSRPFFKIFKQSMWLYNHDSQIFRKRKKGLRTSALFYQFFPKTSGSSFERIETGDSLIMGKKIQKTDHH
jgi:hypothetical protein